MSGTISKPCLQDNVNLVSKVLHRHISNPDFVKDKDSVLETKFDIDNFVSKEYRSSMVVLPLHLGGAIFVQRRKFVQCGIPTLVQVTSFLTLIFSRLRLNVQCAIVGLLYCERLMSQKKISMTERNWKPILLVCLLESSKMWDDLASWNVEFSELFPCLGIKAINHLEKMFLNEMSYNLFVSGSMYAKYYFALRGLRYTDENQIPKNYLDFQLGKKQRVRLGLGTQLKFKKRKHPSSAVLRGYDEKSTVFENKELVLDGVTAPMVLPSNPPSSRCLQEITHEKRKNLDQDEKSLEESSAVLPCQPPSSRLTKRRYASGGRETADQKRSQHVKQYTMPAQLSVDKKLVAPENIKES